MSRKHEMQYTIIPCFEYGKHICVCVCVCVWAETQSKAVDREENVRVGLIFCILNY